MDFYIMTLFPDMVEDGLSHSITGRAVKKGLISIHAVNIRDYTNEKHGKVDDYPFGGGAGMVMQVQPVYDCYKAVLDMVRAEDMACVGIKHCSAEHADCGPGFATGMVRDSRPCDCKEPYKAGLCEAQSTGDHAGSGPAAGPGDPCCRGGSHDRPRVLYMSPQGKRFTQETAGELSKEKALIFLCGHYEGVDERALKLIGAEEISLGDFVLTGGELPAMCMIDCIARLIPGVLSKGSAEEESFSDGLLEYPQYSRPEIYEGLRVPEVLLSGHHANVDRWRREQSIIRTFEKRPDLIESAVLSKDERRFLGELTRERASAEDNIGNQEDQSQ